MRPHKISQQTAKSFDNLAMAQTVHNLFAGFLCISFILLLTIPVSMNAVISKCCPIGSQITVNSGLLPDCVKRENGPTWDSYNIKVSINQTQFPQCDKNQIRRLPPNALQSIGCLDKTRDGRLFTIRCKGQRSIAVNKLNQCCPLNHCYDDTKCICVPCMKPNLHYREVFANNVMIFEHNVPDCADDEVFIEIQASVNDVKISMIDRNLRIKNQPILAGRIVQTNKYCIGSVEKANSEISERYISVWACQPRNFSDKIRHIWNNSAVLMRPLCRIEVNTLNFDVYSMLLIISSVFLAMTLVVYLALPKVCKILFVLFSTSSLI